MTGNEKTVRSILEPVATVLEGVIFDVEYEVAGIALS
jgi:hypothetical protein